MKKSLTLLYELIELRKTDYDKFMDKLYTLITDEFTEVTTSKLFSKDEMDLVLKSMIKFFESKEEYEKCDVLLHLINHNK